MKSENFWGKRIRSKHPQSLCSGGWCRSGIGQQGTGRKCVRSFRYTYDNDTLESKQPIQNRAYLSGSFRDRKFKGMGPASTCHLVKDFFM